MAISDYLMTRLALAAQARGLARGTEEARAQREAAAQRANLAYLNTLLESGGQLASKVPSMVEEAAAKESAARLQEALSGVGLPTDGEAPVPAATPSAIIPPPAAEAPAIPTTPAAAAKTLIGRTPEEADAYFRNQLGVMPELPLPAGSYKAPQFKLPDVPETAAPPPSAPPPIPEYQRQGTVKGRDINTEKLVPTPTFTATKTPPVQIKTQTLAAPLPEREAVAVPARVAATTPSIVPPAAPTETKTEEQLLAAAETVGVEPGLIKALQDIKETKVDPIEAQREALVKKITSYTPQKHEKNSVQVANDIVEQVKKDRPAGNPIWNLLSFGEYNKKIEAADRLAKRLVAQEVEGLRTKQEEKRYAKFIQTAQLEAEQLAAAQKKQLEEKKLNIKVGLQTINPQNLYTKLENFSNADRDIDRTYTAARNLLKSDAKFPGGFDATLNSALAAIGAELKPVKTAGGGIAGQSVSITGAQVDSKRIEELINQIQSADMPPEAKEFQSALLSTIQTLAKAREGKSLTDADLRFYLQSLIPTDVKDPASILRSLNKLREFNANSFNNWSSIASGMMDINSIPFRIISVPFTEEELAAATARQFAGVSPTAARAAAGVGAQPTALAPATDIAGAAEGVVRRLTGGTRRKEESSAP